MNRESCALRRVIKNEQKDDVKNGRKRRAPEYSRVHQ
jgi:hypothetical protein